MAQSQHFVKFKKYSKCSTAETDNDYQQANKNLTNILYGILSTAEDAEQGVIRVSEYVKPETI